jgi:superoxide reductase
MTKRNQVYRCEKCGNLINIVHDADANLVCCGDEMKLLEPNTVDAAQEKHIPIVEKSGSTVNISVGSVPHPMEKEHFIETISILTDNRLYRLYLSPGDKPEAIFNIDGDIKCVRAYCNLHGLWKSE